MKKLFLLLVAGLLTHAGQGSARPTGPGTPLPVVTSAAAPGGGGTPSAPPEVTWVRTFATAINTVFQYLDKSRIPSGILEEYGLQAIDHVPFTGLSYTTANQLDIN